MGSILDGLTRPALAMPELLNPGDHSPIKFANRIQAEVVGPDGEVKQRIDHTGNIMATFGLNKLAEFLATLTTAGSDFVKAGGIGSSTTAAASTQTGLLGSLAIVHMSQASMDGSHSSPHTAAFVMTFASNNPAGAATVEEVGLFHSNVANNSMVARSVLGTDSINKGASDEIRMTYQLIMSTV